MFAALIILWGSLNNIAIAQLNSNLQLNLGDKVSIYSEKAYRKNQGTFFEAVGNVVIKSGKDTLYGEKASFDMNSGEINIEGNVRFIGQGFTIYGSQMQFFSSSGQLIMRNARLITSEFTIVAKELFRKEENLYDAIEAQFTTCKDCVESWAVSGKKIEIQLNQYVYITNALIKLKGVNVVYVPYIVLPIKNQRESGLLFPLVSQRFNEGLALQQPFFWAIADDKDATITPSFWGSRGYGVDLEYRQIFGQNRWVEYYHRLVNDTIYLPGKTSLSDSGEKYFRNFGNIETHLQWTNELTQHFQVINSKDLDFVRDFPFFTDPQVSQSDLGATTFLESRSEWYNLGIESLYRRNMLISNPEDFDDNYVQIVPSLYFNISPIGLYQSEKLMLQNISIGLDSDYTIFRQVQTDETNFLRNVRRLDARPYLLWHFFSYGPISMHTDLVFDYQEYNFFDKSQENFQKYAANITTEFSFTMDKIFGLAYEQTVPVSSIKKNNELVKIKKIKKENTYSQQSTIGMLPDFESALTEDTVTIVKNSYRHSQEYKFIHHYITAADTNGNLRFENQISSTEGWFDYRDAIQKDLANIGSNATRTTIPRANTLEFQWNNNLIRKTAKKFNSFEDQHYLRDNFNYQKIGYFNISQGLLLESEKSDSFTDILTRLHIDTGFEAGDWGFNIQEFYFHQTSDHLFNISVRRRVDQFNFLAAYNNNTFDESNLETIRLGLQFRPADQIGFSYLKDHDLSAKQNIRSIYQVDLMPNNNCWIFNLGYSESVVARRYSFNFVFNFGNDDFKQYSSNFFNFNRLLL